MRNEGKTTPRTQPSRLDYRLIVCSLLEYSGAVFLWERIVNRRRPLIVYYHNVHAPGDDISWCHERSLSMPVDLFRQQIEYLRRHYALVSLEEAVQASHPRVLAITFDDGYRGVYQHAFPVLREYRIPATVFLVSDFLGSSSVPWWDQLLHRLQLLRQVPSARRTALLAGLPESWISLLVSDFTEVDVLSCYKTADASVRHNVDDALASVFAAPYVHHEPVFLSASEIREMQTGGISFGAHSRTHPLLPWLDDAILVDELRGSQQAVESLTGRRPCWFAYPDGIFTEREQVFVEALGFAGAVQTFRYPGTVGRYAIPRVGLNVASTSHRDGQLAVAKLRCVLAGITKQRLRQVLRG